MVFNQGVLHYQLNDNCSPAKMYAVFNHHDPGTLSVPIRLNTFKKSALQAAYGVRPGELDFVLDSAPTGSPAPGSARCLHRCRK